MEKSPRRGTSTTVARQSRVGGVHRNVGGMLRNVLPDLPGKRQVEQKLIPAVADQHAFALEPVRLGDDVAQLVGERVGIG